MHRRTMIALLAVGATWSTDVFGQDYPSRPVSIVVPFAPGGPNDVVARLLAGWLGEGSRAPFIVENKAGAGGTLGSASVARAAANGQTLLIATTATLSVSPSLYKSLPYNPESSFAPISLIASSPLVIAINRSVPVSSVAELVEYARQRPDQLNFGTPGRGTIPHLAGELFQKATNTRLTHVPFRGGSAATSDLVGGHVDIVFEAPASLLPHRDSSAIRLLAVTAPERIPSLPDTPTVREAGVPDYAATFWTGLVAPARTPPAVVALLDGKIRTALARREAQEALEQQGLSVAYAGSEAFGERIRQDTAFWAAAARDAGISPE